MAEIMCPQCRGSRVIRWGKGGGGRQKYRCQDCKRQFVAGADHLLNPAKKEAALKLIAEGVPTKKIAAALGISRRWTDELKRRMTDAPR